MTVCLYLCSFNLLFDSKPNGKAFVLIREHDPTESATAVILYKEFAKGINSSNVKINLWLKYHIKKLMIGGALMFDLHILILPASSQKLESLLLSD